jgi:pilus assembly protein Flp/PilA
MIYAKNFLRQDDGVTALEYGMIAALIAAVIIGTVKILGGKVDTAFGTLNTALT